MTTKQLANVLIKILGLSVIVHRIPYAISGLLSLFLVEEVTYRAPHYWMSVLSGWIMPMIGVYLVLKSRNVAAFLFKDENE